MKSMIRCFASLLCVLAPVVALAQQLTVSAAASMTDAFKKSCRVSKPRIPA